MIRPRRSLTLVTGPTTEPVALADAKAWARIDEDDDDSVITGLITAARMNAEEYLRRALLTQTWKLTLDLPDGGIDRMLGAGTYDLPSTILHGDLPRVIELPKGPIQSITSVVTYDLTGAATTFDPSNYRLDSSGERLVLAYGAIWPTNIRRFGAVEVTYAAGYGDTAALVPQPIKNGMLIHVASLYEQRGNCADAMDLPPGTKQLYNQYRIKDYRCG